MKKADHWRINAFELWFWRRLWNVPWTARRSNQSILKEISPEHSLEGLMLKLQYFGPLIKRADSLQKTLMFGKIEGKRRGGWQGMRWSESIIDSVDMNLGKLYKTVKDRKAWLTVFHGVVKNRTQWLNNNSKKVRGPGPLPTLVAQTLSLSCVLRYLPRNTKQPQAISSVSSCWSKLMIGEKEFCLCFPLRIGTLKSAAVGLYSHFAAEGKKKNKTESNECWM